MYRRVAKEILSTGDEDPGSPNGRGRTAPLQQLRLMLQKVVLGLSGDEGARAEFERLQWIAHLTASKALAAEQGAAQPRRKIAVSMLRHIREVPADKAFYEAGMCCKAAGDLDMAFVFLNRYLDITEGRARSRAARSRERSGVMRSRRAISARDLGARSRRAISQAVEEHEPSSTSLDNSDFASTEIPYDFPLPEKQFLSDAEREKARGTGVPTLRAHVAPTTRRRGAICRRV